MAIAIVLGYGTDDDRYGRYQHRIEKIAGVSGGFSHTVL